jgi:hypothetical protein
MSDTPISLASLMTPSKTVTIDFPGYSDMTVDLCYLAREELVIKGWSGFKYRYLEELLLVDVSAFDPDDYLGFTQENAELLMKNSSDFDTWVTETVGDLENFTGNK